MQSVLITGGTGFFGQAFTERLLKDGLATRVCIYSRDEHKQADMDRRLNDPRLRFFIGDVRDRHRLTRALESCDTVIHAAALKRIETGFYNVSESAKTNILGAMNLIEAAKDAKVERVVALSSDKAYNPISMYGASKLTSEFLFLGNNVPGRYPRFAVCRYGNVWKSTGSVVPKWQQMLEDGETHVPLTDPECTRFFMHMHEAVQLVLDTLEQMPNEPAIPDLPAYRLGDLAEAMGASVIVTGLPRWEKLHESMDDNRCSKDAPRMTIDQLRAEL